LSNFLQPIVREFADSQKALEPAVAHLEALNHWPVLETPSAQRAGLSFEPTLELRRKT
jgi:hypothetical protein